MSQACWHPASVALAPHELPYEIFTLVLACLEPRDLARCMRVCGAWNTAANDGYVWDLKCRELWADKVYVPKRCMLLKSSGEPKDAYRLSLVDAERKTITAEELCSFEWNFRFKEAAGEGWTESDPWWSKRPATVLRFFDDGHVGFRGDWGPRNAAMRVERRWRFITRSGSYTCAEGGMIQLNNYPPSIVSRCKRNWGFVMQSCWVVYLSFPMPPRGAEPDLEDAKLEVTVQTQHHEAMAYNMGVQLGGGHMQHLAPQHIVAVLQALAGNDVEFQQLLQQILAGGVAVGDDPEEDDYGDEDNHNDEAEGVQEEEEEEEGSEAMTE